MTRVTAGCRRAEERSERGECRRLYELRHTVLGVWLTAVPLSSSDGVLLMFKMFMKQIITGRQRVLCRPVSNVRIDRLQAHSTKKLDKAKEKGGN